MGIIVVTHQLWGCYELVTALIERGEAYRSEASEWRFRKRCGLRLILRNVMGGILKRIEFLLLSKLSFI